MKNGNGRDYANKHPDESKSSEVASAIGKPINISNDTDEIGETSNLGKVITRIIFKIPSYTR